MTPSQAPKKNYQRALEEILRGLDPEAEAPTLLLHSCCGPCSSYVLEYLREYFRITVFYYNPNITEDEEYRKRLAEEQRLIAAYNAQVDEGVFGDMHFTGHAHRIDILEAPYDPETYLEQVRGMEDLPEGGERCTKCFALRLRKTAETAAAVGADYCSTTLTISPLKDAQRLNRIGEACAARCGVRWLPGDFKKKDGYKRSIELSRIFDLYRQDYCGCVFSKRERERADRAAAGTEGTADRI